ncbi:SsgA family sporulation/cell division regulator [Amycolatopsis sp. CFH S0078]|uniref:SsgA family sporulation/cell division regulator n=1 Tax=Amycolatopsis sp. CFH S0078 TaxID=1644108 RepID=UPI0014303C59|nr:SsgA family sporulation/cell division regulator [Amycolatopsis sp. CFH S0078]
MKITWLAEPMVKTGAVSYRIPVRMEYDPAYDPYAVALRFLPAGRVLTWLLARDLLRDGLSRMAGEGDVQVTPGAVTVGVHLCSDAGEALAVFARDDVTQFLRSTYIEVPDGTEAGHIDWDRFPGVAA